MITRAELEMFKSVLGFNVWQIERDYLQHLILLFLSRHTKEDLVFKGGTALQKAYALHRFSIDLDFTIYKLSSEIEVVVSEVQKNLTMFGYQSFAKKRGATKDSLEMSLTINGPLYNGRQTSTAVIRLEISMRENVLRAPVKKEVVPVYTDVQPYLVLVMDINEILAEKIRAIMTRRKPRDIFDTKFIIDKGYKPDIQLINDKLSYYKILFKKETFNEAVVSQKPIWDKEMKLLLADSVPTFDSITKPLLALF